MENSAMNGSGRSLGIGFIFSTLTIVLLASLVLFPLALITYLISIIFRARGWRKIHLIFEENNFELTAKLVKTLGLLYLFFALLILFEAVRHPLFLALTILVWVFYSLLEFLSFIKLGRKGYKLFYFSCISIIGIAMVTTSVILSIFDEKALILIYFLLYYILASLGLSSLISSIASFKIKTTEK